MGVAIAIARAYSPSNSAFPSAKPAAIETGAAPPRAPESVFEQPAAASTTQTACSPVSPSNCAVSIAARDGLFGDPDAERARHGKRDPDVVLVTWHDDADRIEIARRQQRRPQRRVFAGGETQLEAAALFVVIDLHAGERVHHDLRRQ